ncbi:MULTISPECIES: hypothetical protein [Streptomyces]|uniref:hypothetical protein n=1 Tax=Streptomyces TaxID=1883 RepID=UPI0023DDD18A|nr:hypothetical protein [Streptomyces sp. MBT27]
MSQDQVEAELRPDRTQAAEGLPGGPQELQVDQAPSDADALLSTRAVLDRSRSPLASLGYWAADPFR